MLKKILKFFGVSVAVLVLAFACFAWWMLQPRVEPRPLPTDIVSIQSPEGLSLLASAASTADYEPLSEHFASQSLKSYCGVASSVTVLSAMGRDVDQSSFFTADASRVRSRLQVTFGGMSLTDLSRLLRAHGAVVSEHHADSFTAGQFREAVVRNLSRQGDFLIVNYQREALGQHRVGHISPLAAYDNDSDRVLVMDTASYYYPYSWVPLEKLYMAMATTDSSTGRMRGYLEVTGMDAGR